VLKQQNYSEIAVTGRTVFWKS